MKREKNIFILMVLLFCILFFPAGNVKADEMLSVYTKKAEEIYQSVAARLR